MRFLLLLAVAAGLLFSCAPSKKELLTKMDELEKQVDVDEDEFNVVAAKNLELTYVDFLDYYKEDSIYADVLYKAGAHAQISQSSRLAADLLEEFIEKYPDHPKYAEAHIDLSIVYETQMFDLEKAAHYLNMFIEKFPDHELIEVAKEQLRFLGKTPDEIAEEMLGKLDSINFDSITP